MPRSARRCAPCRRRRGPSRSRRRSSWRSRDGVEAKCSRSAGRRLILRRGQRGSPDTKTGASLRPLSHAACDVLRALPRMGALVFPSSDASDKRMNGFHKTWLRIAAKAGLPADVTPHVLRHSFASIAVDLGLFGTDDRRAHRPSQGERDEQVCSPCRRDAFAGRGRRGAANRGVHGRGESVERGCRVSGRPQGLLNRRARDRRREPTSET